MKKKSFILHANSDGTEVLVPANAFCGAFKCVDCGNTVILMGEDRIEVKESIHEVQNLYEETEE